MDHRDQQQQQQARELEASTIIIPDSSIGSDSSKSSSEIDEGEKLLNKTAGGKTTDTESDITKGPETSSSNLRRGRLSEHRVTLMATGKEYRMTGVEPELMEHQINFASGVCRKLWNMMTLKWIYDSIKPEKKDARLSRALEEKEIQRSSMLDVDAQIQLQTQQSGAVVVGNEASPLKINDPSQAARSCDVVGDDIKLEKKSMLDVGAQMQPQIQQTRALVGNEVSPLKHTGTGMNINDPSQATASCDAVGAIHIYQKYGSDYNSLSVKEHENKDLNLLRAAYVSMKGDDWRERLEETSSILKQRSPLGNTLLHVAARYGNDEAAEHVTRQAHKLLKVQNSNGDTALHVAARAGNISTLQKLLATYFHQESTKYCSRFGQNFIWTTVAKNILEDMLSLALSTNKEGNTFFHEALINSNKQCGIFRVLEAPFVMNNEENSLCTVEADFKLVAKQVAASIINNEEKSALYMAIEAGYKEDVSQLLDHCLGVPIHGKSPLLAAIVKRDQGMLDLILSKKPEWHHLRDADGRTPLHYAASIGYIEGVRCLLGKCTSCAIERDNYGFYPLHLASDGGHVGVIDELLEYSLDPPEIVDKDGRNILHIAAESGELNVVKYILQSPELGNMINQKDANGNTPLHLASLHCRPRIVHYLTWDKRVDLTLLNKSNQTPLDAIEQTVGENPPLSQRLTWSALKSAAAPRSSVKTSPHSTSSSTEKKAANLEQFKDRIDTLIVVSTLIITATFAAGFTMPGGNSDSDSDAGIANMINHSMFHLFIFSITVSMYGAISVTIILIWSRLGDLLLILVALKVATPLLGITLGTLSLSFLAGVYLVISKLTWLVITFLVLSAVFVFMVVLLYALLFFPSASSNPVMRYISYFPFMALAILVERKENGNRNGSTTFSKYT